MLRSDHGAMLMLKLDILKTYNSDFSEVALEGICIHISASITVINLGQKIDGTNKCVIEL